MNPMEISIFYENQAFWGMRRGGKLPLKFGIFAYNGKNLENGEMVSTGIEPLTSQSQGDALDHSAILIVTK